MDPVDRSYWPDQIWGVVQRMLSHWEHDRTYRVLVIDQACTPMRFENPETGSVIQFACQTEVSKGGRWSEVVVGVVPDDNYISTIQSLHSCTERLSLLSEDA